MFDWLKFDISRLAQPVVIVGLIIMVLGLVLVLTSRNIGASIEKKYNKNYTTIVYIVSAVILLVGIFMTVLGAK